MSGPLAGVKVLELAQIMAGPTCGLMLADLGADVIKIERPGQGDLSRWSIPDPAGLDNPVFASLNRNKRSVALNLKHESAREIVRELVRSADVIVNNFRPDVMERMGLGYDRLREENPRIIYAFGTGFGKSGPYAHKGGQDVLAQAMTGVMARKADPDHPLAIYATALADYSAAMHLVQGILLALLHREKTGKGQMVDVSLYDSMLSMQMQEASMWLMRKEELNWAAMPLSGVFDTRDGALVLVGAFKENPLRDICAALEIEDLSREERFSTIALLRENRSELQALFRKRFRDRTTAHWIHRLEAQDLLCSPVKSLSEALDDPQTKENRMLIETGDGRPEAIRMVGTPVHLSQAPLGIRHAPPHLGEHTDAVLRELGYDSARIESLREGGVVA